MKKNIILILLVVVPKLYHGIKCYTCSSYNDDQCLDHFNKNESFLIDCNEHDQKSNALEDTTNTL